MVNNGIFRYSDAADDVWYSKTSTPLTFKATYDYGYADTTSLTSPYSTKAVIKYATNTTKDYGPFEVLPDVMPKDSKVKLPDGSMLVVDKDGNYIINDQDAKVVYKANRVREFSPHINASDMLAQFIESLSNSGVKANEVLNLPIHLFVSWLIIEAAERDGDKVEMPPLLEAKELVYLKKPKCLKCSRYISKLHARHNFPFCNPLHAEQHLLRIAA